MKKILFAVTVILLAVFTFAACAPSGEDNENIKIRSYTDSGHGPYSAENEYLKLTFDPETTWFTLTNKKTGEVMESNPADAADSTASGIDKRRMQSLLVLVYSDLNGVTNTLDSYTYSVLKEYYEYDILPNGFEVHFTIGDIERTFYIPEAVPEYRMTELLEPMEKSDKDNITSTMYRLINIEKLRSSENEADMLEKYPDLRENNVYALVDGVQTYLKEMAEGIFEKYGYTVDDYYKDLEYYESNRVVTEPVFNVTLRIELDGENLKVTIPFDEIEYRSKYPPVSVEVLPYFLRGGVEDEGFMFVPDGSGALINLNNGKNNQNPYVNSLYGWDVGLARYAIVNDPKAHYPVFGLEKNGSSVLCIIEEGVSYGNIKADVAGRSGCPYNSVFSDFDLLHSETMDISSKSDKKILLFEKGFPAGEQLSQTYYFCGDGGYMKMAETYRDYLMAKYPELQKKTESNVPVAVEITGAVNRVQHIAGIPSDMSFKLTTYKEAEAIVNDMSARGFFDVNYRITGWFNKSYQHSPPSSINLISTLGSKKDLENLIKTINNSGSDVFLEADFLYMRNTKAFDGFNINRDASRYVNRKRVQSYPYSFIWYGERIFWGTLAYQARPEYMMGMIDGYINKISAYGAENVAFRTIGNDLAGDYNEKRRVSRETVMNMQTEKLKELYTNGNSIMLQSGYSYAAPYADFITDIPLTWQGYGILDEEIPFYQIVLHGLVSYAGRPVNLAEDYQLNILRTVEAGAGLYFAFMHESPAVLQDSKYHTYYANQYSMWADEAEVLYKEFNEQMGDIYNQYIINYTILRTGISVTEYENGVQVIVNKTSAPYDYGGKTVQPRDYLVVRGGM
ncbi:MAG: DUF5696 domain-containing protein [Oscillospiraceae bacterium]|nr:DUF5696 domain-containing protein [Oscillospiraceae bacterium]